MPIVRLARDPRGFDTVYLLEGGGGRRPSDGLRLLYFWTAPPGLRIGREPFDESRRRDIEKACPGVMFDWTALTDSLQGLRQQAAFAAGEGRRDVGRPPRTGRARRNSSEVPALPATSRTDSGGAGDGGAVVTTPEQPSPQVPAPTEAQSATSEKPGDQDRSAKRRRRRGRGPASAGATTTITTAPIIDS